MRVLLLFWAALSLGAETGIERAFGRMYNLDFPGAHSILDAYIAQHPEDPLGYVVRAAAYLFSELDRLQILEGEFFLDDKKIIEKKKLKADPQVRAKLFAAVEQGQQRARDRLAKDPNDRNALYSMTLSTGVITDYTSLIDKRQWGSLAYLKQSHRYAVRLLRLDPEFYDAYLTTGLSEYIIANLPFYFRWFARFDDVEGSKSQGIERLRTVAEKGHYMKGFARIVLAIAYMREKKPEETRRLLLDLVRDYPENPLLKKELAKVSAHLARKSEN